jgi:rhamnosyltransferase
MTKKNENLENAHASQPPTAPSKQNICAVVVSYFPDGGFGQRLRLISNQVDHVVVVDNGSGEAIGERIRAALSTAEMSFIPNPSNLGVATALNQGVKVAQGKGYAWTLLFDQDTVPWSTTVQKLASAYGEFLDKDHLAALGCDRFLKAAARGPRWWTESKTIITSGTMLSLAAARAVGPFRDEFFIDCVDFDFCLRARAKGFSLVEILEPIMGHSVGAPKPTHLLWFQGRTSNHRPERWYYMVRNNLTLIREYFWRDPGWAFRAAIFRARDLVLVLLLENSRMRKVKYVGLGFWDALLRRFDRKVL